MGREIRGLTLFETNDDLDLDEGILRLKELIIRLDVESVLQPTTESVDVTFEIIHLIRNMNVPVRMTNEGIA